MAHKHDANRWWVYVLVDPRTNTPFYVGLSCNPARRLKSHQSDWSGSANPRIRCLRRAGLQPKLGLLMEFDDLWSAMTYEAKAIRKLRRLDNHLRAEGHCICKRNPSDALACNGAAYRAEYSAYYERSVYRERNLATRPQAGDTDAPVH